MSSVIGLSESPTSHDELGGVLGDLVDHQHARRHPRFVARLLPLEGARPGARQLALASRRTPGAARGRARRRRRRCFDHCEACRGVSSMRTLAAVLGHDLGVVVVVQPHRSEILGVEVRAEERLVERARAEPTHAPIGRQVHVELALADRQHRRVAHVGRRQEAQQPLVARVLQHQEAPLAHVAVGADGAHAADPHLVRRALHRAVHAIEQRVGLGDRVRRRRRRRTTSKRSAAAEATPHRPPRACAARRGSPSACSPAVRIFSHGCRPSRSSRSGVRVPRIDVGLERRRADGEAVDVHLRALRLARHRQLVGVALQASAAASASAPRLHLAASPATATGSAAAPPRRGAAPARARATAGLCSPSSRPSIFSVAPGGVVARTSVARPLGRRRRTEAPLDDRAQRPAAPTTLRAERPGCAACAASCA